MFNWDFIRKAGIYEMHQLYDVYDYSELAPVSFGPSVTGRGKSWTVFVLYASCSSVVLISVGVFYILGTSVLCSYQWPPSNITWYRLLFCWLCLSIFWENIADAVMSTCYFSIMHYFCITHHYDLFMFIISVYLLSLTDVTFNVTGDPALIGIQETETVEELSKA